MLLNWSHGNFTWCSLQVVLDAKQGYTALNGTVEDKTVHGHTAEGHAALHIAMAPQGATTIDADTRARERAESLKAPCTMQFVVGN